MRDKYQRPAFLDHPHKGGVRLTTSAMIASIAGPDQPTRTAPFGHALVELAKSRPEIVGLTADLAKYTDLHVFAKAFPDRFYQMGMAEQLLMGAAAGMAREGFIPFVTTYHGAYSEKSHIKNLYNSVMARSDITIANSNYTATLIKSRYKISDERMGPAIFQHSSNLLL